MLQFLIHVFGYDIWFFVSHLLLHHPALYKYHKIHHEKRFPTYKDTYHGHWLEGPFQSLGYLLPFFILKCGYVEAIMAGLYTNTRGLLRHDPRGSWLVGNHHLLHHEFFDCNYGEPWLDWLYGTLRYEVSKEHSVVFV